MRRPVQVLVYPLRKRAGRWEFLLLRRIEQRGGFWQGITGGVEDDEELQETARRELREETGLEAQELGAVAYTYTVPVEDAWLAMYPESHPVELTEHVFWARVDSEAVHRIDPSEHDASRWCGFEAALGMLKWPENIEALRRCHAALEGRQ